MTRQVLLSWLFAFVFFTGLSVGSLMLLMAHALTGGSWGKSLRPYLLASTSGLPLLALLALILLIGVPELYPWAAPKARSHDAVLQAQSWYLNRTFFTLRTVAYFAVWWLCWVQLPRRPRLAAPGLIICVLTASLAGVDWLMSLQPHWRSTAFGMMLATGWTLSAAALAILWATGPANSRISPALCNDLGSLLLALLLGWSYLAFMQYLTVWTADLPAETAWYRPRTLTSWQLWTGFLVVFHFCIPFAALLSRWVKRRRLMLAAIAALLLIAHLANALWLVLPDAYPQALAVRWSDLAAPVVLGALWLYVVRRGVRV
ncbi:MAG TPA: hypothetical protein VGV09_21080 [Steroidobacteraceae bacterium]|nr:hypothetical protein [Steroidobacteraceae bacterium]